LNDDELTDEEIENAEREAAIARWADPKHQPSVPELFSRPVYGPGFRGDVPVEREAPAPEAPAPKAPNGQS
jgi:hypothetical protein